MKLVALGFRLFRCCCQLPHVTPVLQRHQSNPSDDWRHFPSRFVVRGLDSDSTAHDELSNYLVVPGRSPAYFTIVWGSLTSPVRSTPGRLNYR
ncbi:hypothetical protein BDW74DRAFT_145713 [Aspergillus multicolor]|uniref:uncharacterized protein n=1 Tax=Aspergillus multicolor TaxID=41759 RepID=UPI003CCDCD0A